MTSPVKIITRSSSETAAGVSAQLQNPAPERAFPYAGLFVLATAVFLAVTAEMLPTGLLPEMSRAFTVTEAQTGQLVTVFALSVVVFAVPMAALTRRFSRHSVVVVVLVAVAVSSVLSALAPSYELLVGARVVGGIAHGLFWAVVGVYSAHLVPKRMIGRAVAITTGGGTLAFVLGVPLGTVVGQAFGWRTPFAVIGVLALVGAVLIWRFLPRVAGTPRLAPDARAAARDRTQRFDQTIPAIALLCLTIAVLVIGQNTLYTYIAPFLVSQMGVPTESVGGLLFLYGAAGAIALVLTAFVFGTRPTLGVAVGVGATAVAITVLAIWVSNPVVSITAFVVWGVSFGLIPSLMQARLLHTASARIRDTANAYYSTSFNVGIALGAVVGGGLLSSIGLAALPYTYLGFLALGAALLVVSIVLARRQRAAVSSVDGAQADADAHNGNGNGPGTGTGTGSDTSTVAVTVGPKRPVDASV